MGEKFRLNSLMNTGHEKSGLCIAATVRAPLKIAQATVCVEFPILATQKLWVSKSRDKYRVFTILRKFICDTTIGYKGFKVREVAPFFAVKFTLTSFLFTTGIVCCSVVCLIKLALEFLSYIQVCRRLRILLHLRKAVQMHLSAHFFQQSCLSISPRC